MADSKNQNDQPAPFPARHRPTYLNPKVITLIISSVMLTATVYKVLTNDSSWIFRPTARTEWEEEKAYWCSRRPKPIHDCPLPTARYDLDTGFAACYPASGGVWMAELGPLDLQYLDIPRFKSTERSWDQEEEDRFCDRLRPFGGSWYSPKFANYLGLGGECTELAEWGATFYIERVVGFPETGGVWVLSGPEEEYWESDGNMDESFFDGLKFSQNALTMEEKCMALEMSGAVFCQDISSCSDFEDLSKQPWELAEERKIDWKHEARCACEPGIREQDF